MAAEFAVCRICGEMVSILNIRLGVCNTCGEITVDTNETLVTQYGVFRKKRSAYAGHRNPWTYGRSNVTTPSSMYLPSDTLYSNFYTCPSPDVKSNKTDPEVEERLKNAELEVARLNAELEVARLNAKLEVARSKSFEKVERHIGQAKR